MTRHERGAPREQRTVPSVYTLAGSDPHGELVDRSGLSHADLVQIDEVMAALVRLRAAEKRLAEASLRYMELGETDMRALHLLIVSENTGTVATPGAMAESLGISSASTTKLVDRLVAAGHLVRVPHPHDQRTLCVQVTEATARAAHESIGRQHARRFDAAAALSHEQRQAVIDFLEAMTEADLPQGVLAAAENETETGSGNA